MLSTSFFSGNRRTLQAVIGLDQLIIVTAQSLLQRSGDTAYPFRQDSNFFYLTGVEVPDIVLVMQGTEEFLILPKRTKVETIFGGSLNCDQIADNSGIASIYSYQEGWDKYKFLQKNRKIIYTLGQAPVKVSGIDSFFTNPARQHLLRKIKRLNPAAQIQDLRPTLSRQRQVKQPEEVNVIKQAILITKLGIDAARKQLKAGVREYELEEILTHQFKLQRSNHAFSPIVAAGKHTCVLHHVKQDGVLKNGDFVLFDVGAEVQNYAADVSRTYSFSEVSPRHFAIYQAVSYVQQCAIAQLKHGISWKEYAQKVDTLMGEELIKLGLIKQNSREQVRKYFSHGIGHSLGLDTHDVCDYKTIQENMVVTVEPGIYIPEEGVGVRIEDDILITKEGSINLSADIAYL